MTELVIDIEKLADENYLAGVMIDLKDGVAQARRIDEKSSKDILKEVLDQI